MATGDGRDYGRDPIAIYDYTDETGKLLFQVGRFPPRPDGKKNFAQRRAGRTDWKGGIRGVRRVLYRLPAVIAAVDAGERIWIPEGEKDVHALEKLDVVATCNPMGAGKWRSRVRAVFQGCRCRRDRRQRQARSGACAYDRGVLAGCRREGRADLDRVHRISVLDKDGHSTLLTLPDHVPLLEVEIRRLRDNGRTVGMIVIDPIGAFLSVGTDTHRDASVRRALAPLAELAETLDLVVLVVAHLTKNESTRLINRVSGAGAFVNAARSLLVLARSPDDPEGEQGRERVLMHVGSNWGRYAATLAARVEAPDDVDLDDGSRANVGCLVITGDCDIGVEDLQRGADQNGGTDVEEAILAALVDGPKPSRDVKAQIVGELSCSKRTVERAAVRLSEQDELSIGSGGFPRTTTWTLASSGDIPVATSTDLRRVATKKPPATIEDSASSGDSSDSLLPAVRCCCADGGEGPTEDGCCSRCWGAVAR